MSERVILLGIDGLDWRLLRACAAAGRTPHLAGLLDAGAWAEVPVHPTTPGLAGPEAGMNSPTLWTSIATGQYYFQHGVFDFSNYLAPAAEPPLFESGHVRSPRVWDVLGQHNRRSLVVGYYVTYPATPLAGELVSDLFGDVAGNSCTWPASLADQLAQAQGAEDYAAFVQQQQQAAGGTDPAAARTVLSTFTDLSPADIDALLSAPPDDRRRQLLHFRLVYPALRDQQLHRAFLDRFAAEHFDFATLYYRLIDFVGHGFWTDGLDLPAAFRSDFGEVVPRAYEWIDAAVGEVLERCDADDRILILSDHGFAANREFAATQQAADIAEISYGEHAEPAVLLARGGPSRGRLDDVSLLDITPSILDFFQIPQAESLDGGPVAGLLHAAAPRPLPRCSDYGPPPTSTPGDADQAEQEQIRQRLAALGYLDE